MRETWEKTGFKVDLGGLLGGYSYAGTPVVIIVDRARVVGGEIKTRSENDRVEWVESARIPWEEPGLSVHRSRAAEDSQY